MDKKKQRLNDLEGFVRICGEHLQSVEEDYQYGELSRHETWILLWYLNRAMAHAEFEAIHIRFQQDAVTHDPDFEEKIKDAWNSDNKKYLQDAIHLEVLKKRPYDIYHRLLDEQFFKKYGK